MEGAREARQSMALGCLLPVCASCLRGPSPAPRSLRSCVAYALQRTHTATPRSLPSRTASLLVGRTHFRHRDTSVTDAGRDGGAWLPHHRGRITMILLICLIIALGGVRGYYTAPHHLSAVTNAYATNEALSKPTPNVRGAQALAGLAARALEKKQRAPAKEDRDDEHADEPDNPVAPRIVRLGTEYGGWSYDSSAIGSSSIVYSVGIGEDMSWDQAIAQRHGLQVWGFDPTPKSVAFVRRTSFPSFHFTAEGLHTSEGVLTFTKPANPEYVSMRIGSHEGLGEKIAVPVNTLENWMKRFNHTHIDILKLDVEGAEYDFLEHYISNKRFPFTQLLVEFHQRFGVSAKRHTGVVAGLNENGFKRIPVKGEGDTSLYLRDGGF